MLIRFFLSALCQGLILAAHVEETCENGNDNNNNNLAGNLTSAGEPSSKVAIMHASAPVTNPLSNKLLKKRKRVNKDDEYTLENDHNKGMETNGKKKKMKTRGNKKEEKAYIRRANKAKRRGKSRKIISSRKMGEILLKIVVMGLTVGLEISGLLWTIYLTNLGMELLFLGGAQFVHILLGIGGGCSCVYQSITNWFWPVAKVVKPLVDPLLCVDGSCCATDDWVKILKHIATYGTKNLGSLCPYGNTCFKALTGSGSEGCDWVSIYKLAFSR